MPAPPYMPMYWSDYDEDTSDLSLIEHGAYTQLIKVYWQRQGPLPDDDERLARMIRTTPQQWRKLRLRLAEFFQIADGQWHHKRIDAEIARFADKSAKAQRAATKRHASAPADGHANAGANGHADAPADAERTQCHYRLQTTDSSVPNGTARSDPDPDAELYHRARQILGQKHAGAIVTKLKTHYGGSIPRARAAVEQASEKARPRDWLMGIVNKRQEREDAGSPFI